MRKMDFSAVGLSGLCLVHCLALPLFATLSPLLAALAGSEVAHTLFVAAALPVSAAALGPSLVRDRSGITQSLCVAACGAIALLIAGAVGWPSASWETPLTVTGALLLAGVHGLHVWRRRHLLAQHTACGCGTRADTVPALGPIRRDRRSA